MVLFVIDNHWHLCELHHSLPNLGLSHIKMGQHREIIRRGHTNLVDKSPFNIWVTWSDAYRSSCWRPCLGPTWPLSMRASWVGPADPKARLSVLALLACDQASTTTVSWLRTHTSPRPSLMLVSVTWCRLSRSRTPLGRLWQHRSLLWAGKHRCDKCIFHFTFRWFDVMQKASNQLRFNIANATRHRGDKVCPFLSETKAA